MKCANCGVSNREGELICQACGHMLADVFATRQIEAVSDSPVQPSRPRVVTDRLQRLVLDTGEQSLDFAVQSGGEIIVGRGVSAVAGQQALDLADLGGVEKGVSRRHAVIRIDGNAAYLVDLSSTNGTFLNGQRLLPDHHHLLYSNDILRFGAFEMRIELT